MSATTVVSNRFRPEDYVFPESIEEAVSILAKEGDRAKVIAGGTLLFELSQRSMIPQVKKLVDISKLGLSYVKSESDMVRIGATTTLSEIAESESIRKISGLEAVADSVSWIRPVQIRNVATIGGEVCSATPFFDLPPTLTALNAQCILKGPKGQRSASLDGFFLDYLLCDMRPGEILTEIQIPKPKPTSGSAFIKLERTANDFAIVNCASSINLGKDSRCEDISIVLGGAIRLPIRLTKVEKKLLKSRLEGQDVERAAQLVTEIQMPGSVQASASYKKSVSKVVCRDSILLAKDRAMRRSTSS
jgi:aerobic carbon-monoxide dehydrogenase medium subunit